MRALIIQNDYRYVQRLAADLRRCSLPIESVATSNNAIRAEKILGEGKIDLCIVSMGLSGCDMPDFIRKMRNMYPLMGIIITSERKTLSVAELAVSVHAADYIEEPLTGKLVKKAINYIIGIETGGERNEKLYYENKNLRKDLTECAEYVLMYSLMFKRYARFESKGLVDVIKAAKYCRVMYIKLFGKLSAKFDEGEIRQMIHSAGEKYHIIIGPMFTGRMCVIIMDDSLKEESLENSSENDIGIDGFARKLKNLVYKKYSIYPVLGFSGPCLFSKVEDAMDAALHNLREQSEYAFEASMERKKTKEEETFERTQLEKKLYSYVATGNIDAIDTFDSILEKLDADVDKRRNQLLELLTMVAHYAQAENNAGGLGEIKGSYTNLMQLANKLQGVPEENLYSWSMSVFTDIFSNVKENRNRKRLGIIGNVITYMETHYNENITLGRVADLSGVSREHMSRLFKKNTGVTYIEFLTRIRVENAGNLLLHTNNSITDICFMTGFKDPNYFSKVFKRISGKSPAAYQKFYRK